jgi:hypothetical protein
MKYVFSPDFRLRQHYQLLTLTFIITNFFKEGINRNKEDCHQWGTISFLKKSPFGILVEQNVAKKTLKLEISQNSR